MLVIYKIKYLKSSLNPYEPPIQVERTKQWKSPTESIAGWYIVMYPSYLRQSISWTLTNNYGTHTIYTLINLTHILTLQLHIIYLYIQNCPLLYTLLYFNAFSRRFYPKRLTIAFRLYIFISMCAPWESNPQPFAQLTQCSTTEPHRSTHSVWVCTYTCTYNCQFVYCNSLFTCSFEFFFLLSVFLFGLCHSVALR